MTLAYIPRLLCIGLASLFLIHLALGLLVSTFASPAVHYVGRLRPRLAARCLLILRLLPAAGAVFLVIVVCLPSYLWLEPDIAAERVGLACLSVAALAVAMWSISFLRGLRAAIGSRRFLMRCRRAGSRMRHVGGNTEAWIVDGPASLVALGGILHPRVVISRGVVGALSAAQLAAAFRHERAHWDARDNLKRLLILLTPAVLPFAQSSRTLERGWSKFTEWAADDRAVAGSARRSYALAGALVRVARLAAGLPHPHAMLSLVGDADDLAARVDRLLGAPPSAAPPAQSNNRLAVSAGLLAAGLLTLALLHPAALYHVHQALERLME